MGLSGLGLGLKLLAYRNFLAPGGLFFPLYFLTCVFNEHERNHPVVPYASFQGSEAVTFSKVLRTTVSCKLTQGALFAIAIFSIGESIYVILDPTLPYKLSIQFEFTQK